MKLFQMTMLTLAFIGFLAFLWSVGVFVEEWLERMIYGTVTGWLS